MKKLKVSEKIKIVGAVFSVALVMVTALGVTLAYYNTETDKIMNQFTVGNVTTELVEDFYQRTDTEFTKTPKITNTGADPCLVRIRMSVTPESVAEQYVKDQDGRDTGKKYLEISGWSDKWTLKDDGFYYYSEALNPGETSEALFTLVTVNYDETNNPWKDFDIILYHESVQSEVISEGLIIRDQEKIWDAYDKLQ